ncbi:MAG: hydrogenase maturation protease [Armatimonadota bacterium]|nr:hydrogenase maturation protease [Armatimonadota bacterium]
MRILIAGIGNIFLGDDAFGVEVAQRLAQRALPAGVRVTDFGIRGFDLAYAILDGYDVTILVDATPRGGIPGTLYVIEPELNELNGADGAAIETHGLDPVKVLHLVKVLGGQPGRILVVGCEPATFGPEHEGQMGLSAPVQAAVDEAVRLIEELAAKLIDEHSADYLATRRSQP